MNEKTTLLRKRLLFLLVPSIIGIIYLGSTVLSSSHKADKSTVKIKNSTHSCELLNVKKHKDHIAFSIQNNSDKALTNFVVNSRIDSSTVVTLQEEFAFSEGDTVILPGNKYEKVIGIPGDSNRQGEINLQLAAVIFEDNSSEGDQSIIRSIEDNRLGRKIQIMKILPVLDKFSRLSDDEIAFYWNQTSGHDFESALNAPDAESLMQLNKKFSGDEDALKKSEDFKLGIKTGKESIFQTYQELKDMGYKEGASALRNRIVELRNLYSKMINKF